MIIKSVASLLGGEILAEPVFTEKREILIPQGSEIKKDYVPLIQSLGIDSLMIEDPYANYEEPHYLLRDGKFEVYVERVRKLMEGHIYHGTVSLREFEIIAHDILKDFDSESSNVVIDVKERSSNLYEHTVMVTLLAINIARRLKLDNEKQYQIAIGCLLHDIGIRYITVPYENHDWDNYDAVSLFEFRKHTILGFSALEDETWIPKISRKMVLSHHEKLDGSGFPMKQKNKEIECKIIQVCDAFDCYISGMECKRISVQESLKRMTEEVDGLYESKIVKHLVATVAKYPVGTKVRTTEEEHGVVISQTEDPENPIILILNDKIESESTKLNLTQEKHISILHVV